MRISDWSSDVCSSNVSISQPGAAPTEIENQITQRVESAVRSINGVNSINSTAREGNSNTTVEFEIGVDPNDAVAEVKNAVDRSEERRVGKECDSTGRSWGSP